MAGTTTARGKSAGRFRRVREDHARETAEDYTELVLELAESGQPVRPADLVRRLGVSHVTVLRALQRLIRAGVLERDAERGVLLSAEGRRIARAARRRHQSVVAFLVKLGVPSAVAELDAEGIEHHVSETTVSLMADFVRRTGARERAKTASPPRRRTRP